MYTSIYVFNNLNDQRETFYENNFNNFQHVFNIVFSTFHVKNDEIENPNVEMIHLKI